MSGFAKTSQHQLASGKFLSFYARAGDALICRRGRLLVTIESVTQDFVVGRYHTLPLLHDGLVVIEALEATSLELQYRQTAPLLADFSRLVVAFLGRSRQRLAAWFNGEPFHQRRLLSNAPLGARSAGEFNRRLETSAFE